jgi:thioredoxin-dependent peroxiredoxin
MGMTSRELLGKLGTAWIRATGGLFFGIPRPGAAAPGFSMVDQGGQRHGLADYHGRWLVLYFYPRDETASCTLEAQAFQAQLATLRDRGVAVLGVSLDGPESHRCFADKNALRFPLLADIGGTAARAYGVLTGGEGGPHARRITFLIDPGGRVARRYLAVRVEGHVQEVLQDLDDLQARTSTGS